MGLLFGLHSHLSASSETALFAMRAFVVKEYAHPSKIPLSTDAPEPKAGADQVLVDVYSAGLNYFDVRPYTSLIMKKLRLTSA